MYAWIFRHLPGPLWVRIATAVLLLSGALMLLVQFAFPALADFLLPSNSTLGPARQP